MGVMQGPRLPSAVAIPSQGHVFAFSQGKYKRTWRRFAQLTKSKSAAIKIARTGHGVTPGYRESMIEY